MNSRDAFSMQNNVVGPIEIDIMRLVRCQLQKRLSKFAMNFTCHYILVGGEYVILGTTKRAASAKK